MIRRVEVWARGFPPASPHGNPRSIPVKVADSSRFRKRPMAQQLPELHVKLTKRLIQLNGGWHYVFPLHPNFPIVLGGSYVADGDRMIDFLSPEDTLKKLNDHAKKKGQLEVTASEENIQEPGIVHGAHEVQFAFGADVQAAASQVEKGVKARISATFESDEGVLLLMRNRNVKRYKFSRDVGSIITDLAVQGEWEWSRRIVTSTIEAEWCLVSASSSAGAQLELGIEAPAPPVDLGAQVHFSRKKAAAFVHIVDAEATAKKEAKEAGADKKEAGADKKEAGADKKEAGADKKEAGANVKRCFTGFYGAMTLQWSVPSLFGEFFGKPPN